LIYAKNAVHLGDELRGESPDSCRGEKL